MFNTATVTRLGGGSTGKTCCAGEENNLNFEKKTQKNTKILDKTKQTTMTNGRKDAWTILTLILMSVLNGMKTEDRSHRAITLTAEEKCVAPEHIPEEVHSQDHRPWCAGEDE